MDLQDLERELRRGPECTQSLTGKKVEGECKGSMAHTAYCHHDVNQNPAYPVQQRCNQMGYLYDHRLSSQSGRDDTGPFMNSLPLPKMRYANQYPGPQYQQCAMVVCQESPGSSYQHPLGCYQPTFSSTFQPSSYHQTQGSRLHGMPMFSRANHLPPGPPGVGNHQQPDHAAPFPPMSGQGRWLP